MPLRLLSLSTLLFALAGCPGGSGRVNIDAGDLTARCVSASNQQAIDEGHGFACGRNRWCDRVDGICKSGECGYDEDCEEGYACDTENNVGWVDGDPTGVRDCSNFADVALNSLTPISLKIHSLNRSM